jgi:hypothetical protein
VVINNEEDRKANVKKAKALLQESAITVEVVTEIKTMVKTQIT